MYRELTIIQRIAFKGWIMNPESRPYFFDIATHEYFDRLKILWVLSGFEAAINEFFKHH